MKNVKALVLAVCVWGCCVAASLAQCPPSGWVDTGISNDSKFFKSEGGNWAPPNAYSPQVIQVKYSFLWIPLPNPYNNYQNSTAISNSTTAGPSQSPYNGMTVSGYLPAAVTVNNFPEELAPACNILLVPLSGGSVSFDYAVAASNNGVPPVPDKPTFANNVNGMYHIWIKQYATTGPIRPGHGVWMQASQVYGYVKNGVFSWTAPGYEFGWTGYSNGAGGNSTGNRLRLYLRRAGNPSAAGISVTLTHANQTFSGITDQTGRITVDPMPPGLFDVSLGGTVTEGGSPITYSGTLTGINKAAGDMDVTLEIAANGVLESAVIGGSGEEQDSGFFTDILEAAFVPSPEAVDACKTSLGAVTQWGPFGLASVFADIGDAEALAKPGIPSLTMVNGHIAANGPPMQIAFPALTSSSGYVALRALMGISIYVLFAAGIIRQLAPKQVV